MVDFPAAWQKHHEVVKRYLHHRLAEPADAEELLQECFLRLLLSHPRLPDDMAVRAWLLRVAHNLAVDHHRTTRPASPLDEEIAAPAAETPSPLQTLERCIGPLAARLPEGYRLPLTLELEGVPQREIARRCGIGFSGAKSRVQRARRLLRRELERCCRFTYAEDGSLLDVHEWGGASPCG